MGKGNSLKSKGGLGRGGVLQRWIEEEHIPVDGLWRKFVRVRGLDRVDPTCRPSHASAPIFYSFTHQTMSRA